MDDEWNSGMVEKWNIGYEKLSAIFLKRSPSAITNIPSFQFSNTPKTMDVVYCRRIISDLAQKYRLSMIN